jgi:Dual specificity phosphatase, catalytic domain
VTNRKVVEISELTWKSQYYRTPDCAPQLRGRNVDSSRAYQRMDDRALRQSSVLQSRDKDVKRLFLLQMEEAIFGPDLTKISPHLYVGGETAACNIDVLLQHGISHVVDCRMNAYHCLCDSAESSSSVRRICLPVADQISLSCATKLKDDLKHSFHYIDEARRNGTACLVHCSSG